MKNEDSAIARIARLAPVVAEEARASEKAADEDRAARASVLAGACAMGSEAVTSVGDRVAVRFRTWLENSCRVYEATSFAPERLFCLSHDEPRVIYGSERFLMLGPDGGIFDLTYTEPSEDWYEPEKGGMSIHGRLVEYGSAADAVADGWRDVAGYTERLAQALERAVGSRQKRTKSMLASAKKLTAIATLAAK